MNRLISLIEIVTETETETFIKRAIHIFGQMDTPII